jgi:hypothetical protein
MKNSTASADDLGAGHFAGSDALREDLAWMYEKPNSDGSRSAA